MAEGYVFRQWIRTEVYHEASHRCLTSIGEPIPELDSLIETLTWEGMMRDANGFLYDVLERIRTK